MPLLTPTDANVVMVSSGMGSLSILSPALQERFLEVDRAGVIALMREFVDDVERGRHAARGWPSSA